MGFSDWLNRKAIKGLAKTFGIQYRRYASNSTDPDILTFIQIFYINRFNGTTQARTEAIRFLRTDYKQIDIINFLIQVLIKENSWDESDRSRCINILKDELKRQGFDENSIHFK